MNSLSDNVIFYNFTSTIPLAADYTNTLQAAWQHGDTIYYGIRRRGENWIVLGDPLPQYGYTSLKSIFCHYLIHRDGFLNLEIGVDIGYDYVSYEFEIDTGYIYYFGGILYSDKNVKEPEFVIFKIPKELCLDEKIEVKFKKMDGEYAVVGPIGIFKFEKGNELEGGIQSFKENVFFNLSIPSIFKDEINFEIEHPFENPLKFQFLTKQEEKYLRKNFQKKYP